MSDNYIRKDQTGETGNAGEFGTHTRDEAAGVTLITSGAIRVGAYSVDRRGADALPAWPASLGERNISWSYDDVSGDPSVGVTVGDFYVSSYGDEGEIQSTIDEDGDPNWTPEEYSAVEATVLGADARARSFVGQVEYQATTGPGIDQALTALISERPVPATTPAVMSHNLRAELEALHVGFEKVVTRFDLETDGGDNPDKDAYIAMDEAKIAFADNAQDLIRKMLGR